MKGAARALRTRISLASLLVGALASLSASAVSQDRMTAVWVAESGGVLNIAAATGEIAFAIERDLGAAVVAINDVNGDAWIYGKKNLSQYRRDGVRLLDVAVPPATHGGDPVDMAVDGHAGNLWLAIDRELYRFDLQGVLRQTLTQPRAAVGLALDRARSLLWVASSEEVRVYDADGGLQRVLAAGPGDRIGDLAYDPVRGEIWVTLAGALRRYDPAGNLLFQTAGAFVGAVAADGAGGLWLARGFEVMHYDELGARGFSTMPFAGGPDQQIIDLAADPHDASIWVASQRRLRHYAIDGELLAEVSPAIGNGLIRRLHRSGLYADLDAPEVSLVAPREGTLLNDSRPGVELSYFDLGVGVDGSTIVLTARGQPLISSCDAGAAAARCTPAGPLPEGQVDIAATVADFAGNVSARATTRVTIDTVPPVMPAASLIQIGESSGGRARVRGAAGSVEVGSTVRVVNRRTGAAVAVVAAADGSFDAEIAAEPGDELSIVATDAAANGSAALEAAVPDAGLAIDEPVDGATIQHESVLVVGTYRGPLNAAITVAGRPATVVTEAGVVRFYATVPLRLGDNTLTAAATMQDGRTTTRSNRVRREPGAFTVTLSPQQGALPLLVRLNVKGDFGFNDLVLVDFNGDGKWDDGGGGTFNGFFTGFLYRSAGVSRPRTEVWRYNFSTRRYETIYRHTLAVAVFDPAQLEQHTDRVLRGVWSGMQSALAAGQVAGALTAVSADSQAVYREVFESLLPQMPAVFGDFTDIEPLAIAENYAEYVVMNVRAGQARVHVVSFVRGADGIWRIDSM